VKPLALSEGTIERQKIELAYLVCCRTGTGAAVRFGRAPDFLARDTPSNIYELIVLGETRWVPVAEPSSTDQKRAAHGLRYATAREVE
jgi:hypothetical protein